MAAPADVRAYVAAHDLTGRSPWRATGRSVVIATLYASLTMIGFMLDHWSTWVVVWAAQALVLVGSYSATHEAAHGMLYSSRRANRIAGVLWASTILVNSSLWRSFHLEHHAHTGMPEDPESKYQLEIVRPSLYLLLVPGGILFIAELWWQSVGTLWGRFPAYVRTRVGRRAMQFDAAVLLAVTAVVVVGSVAAPAFVLRVWLVPFILTAGVLLPMTAINEHYGCATKGEAFDTTRTVISNRVFRFLVWNSNYHTEHHLVPSVPFHHAPELHRYIEPRLHHVSPSYLEFHRQVLRDCRHAQRPVATSS